MKIIEDFVKKVITARETGVATEHSYRSALEALFNGFDGNVHALNEPKRIACGAPDLIPQGQSRFPPHIA